MLNAEKITKSFGPQVVLKDINLLIRPKERIGVVGRNGAGKSTLVKILGGQLEPDKGVVNAHGASVGYLSQESQCRLGVTIGEEMRSALPGVADVEARLLAASQAVGSGEANSSTLQELAQAADDLNRLETHTLDARIGRVLSGLGFELNATERLTDTYSGGWQMRIAMAKLLLQEPDYLLLDEPTNHLDEAARWWLVSYIADYPGTVVIISHEPEYLNQTVTRILEVKDGQVNDFTGDYNDYERLKQEEFDRQVKEYERQQKELDQTKELIQRFGANAKKASMVKDREKKLEKVTLLEKPKADTRKIYLDFPEAPRSSIEPIVFRNVVKKYGEKTILDGIDLTMVRGDRVSLVGPNGAGKSTLLKLVVGAEKPTSGTVEVNPKTILGYFAQHQAEALDPNRTVMEETLHGLDHRIEELARGLLARLLFRGDDAVFKKVGVLSGGERSRVALAKFLLRPANVYLLDEPSNHLDPAARAVLEEALSRFDGTILMASHDQSLIESVATGVYEVEQGKLIMIKDPAAARDAD